MGELGTLGWSNEVVNVGVVFPGCVEKTFFREKACMGVCPDHDGSIL